MWVLGVLFGVLLLAVLALPYLVSLDALKSRMVTGAEAALHRRVEVGRVRLQILTGLGAGVEKLVVRNREGFETPTLLTAKEVSVKVAFWPLLSKRVEVRKIVLDGVELTVERDPEGRLSIGDFVKAGGRESPAAAETAAAALLVSRIEIDGGRAVFADRKVAPGTTVTTALEDLQGRITDVGPRTPARFDLRARFLADTGRNLTLQGTFGPPPTTGEPVGRAPLKAAFAAKDLALAGLAPYVAAFAPADPGRLTLSGNAEGAPLGTLSVVGRATLAGAAADSKIPSADGTYRLTLDWPSGSLAVSDTLLSVANLPLEIAGRFDGLRGEGGVRVDLRVKTPGEVAIDTVTALPGFAGRLPAGMKLGGRVRLEAKIEGPKDDLAAEASVDAAPFAVASSTGPLFEAPSARATLRGARRGESPMGGRITIPSGKLKNVPFENLASDWSWSASTAGAGAGGGGAGGKLTLVPSATLYGGTLGGRIESDFSKPDAVSRLTLDVSGVQAQPLLESATTLRNVFSGALNGHVAVESRGLGWDAISKTGKGDGRLSVADADLRTVRLMPEAARALSAIGQVAGFQVPPGLESTKFSKLETSLALANGRVATPDLTLAGPDVGATANGSIGLDRTLDYSGRLILGPSIVKSFGKTGRYVADAEGRIALPFRASGPVASPKVTIDESIVLELGRRALARQAGEKVGGTAGRILGDVLQGGEGKSPGPADLLQQLLRPSTRTPTPARPRP
jgi:hypothetical protein